MLGQVADELGDAVTQGNLWQTAQDARAGQTVLVPHPERLLEPLMAGPSQLVGFGEVTASDLSGRARTGTPRNDPGE